MDFNTEYLNKTPNKTPRGIGTYKPRFVVWHETAGYGSLEWNLVKGRGGYNYLIKRSGEIYHYVDERRFIAHHAGIGDERPPWNGESRWMIDGRLYTGYGINVASIGVEIEGPNDSTPITAAQRAAAIALMRYFRTTYGIPLRAVYHPEHVQVAPYYKTDLQGATISTLVDEAAKDDTTPAQRFSDAHNQSGGVWRGPGLLSPGYPVGEMFEYQGKPHQRYERAVARLEGDTVVWLLLREIMALP